MQLTGNFIVKFYKNKVTVATQPSHVDSVNHEHNAVR